MLMILSFWIGTKVSHILLLNGSESESIYITAYPDREREKGIERERDRPRETQGKSGKQREIERPETPRPQT